MNVLTPNVVLVIACVVFAAVFFYPRLVRANLWRATVTPLASIIGSGFLVAGPILAHAAGAWAWLAMLALCLLAYWFGAAIRYNISHLETHLDDNPAAYHVWLERLSELALALAYFVSVAYYLNLFAAFGLRIGEVLDPLWIRIVSTVVIAAIGLLGALRGLAGLERLEVWVVSLKMTLIGGLLVALALANFREWQAGELVWAVKHHDQGMQSLTVLLGLVILVQGFETSRYLGSKYSAEVRVRSMRWAQWIATVIYIAFLLLITSQFGGGLPKQGGETAIIDLLRPIGTLLGPLLILTALSSQLSAAVADMNGAGGLLAEASGRRFPVRIGNLLTALVAIGITWFANIYEIITYASKMFVAYYTLQSLQATLMSWSKGHKLRAGLFALAVLVGLCVMIFAQPVEA
ncbi:hypothetical protein [Pseudomonas sp. RL_15y_Pfl2_60]|uniref:hypothetical protein n=1 Tax=Pseudomonas sp. RL_15y_Pfl2_60 TaxID=3088709 RepID=UPI0030DC0C0A